MMNESIKKNNGKKYACKYFTANNKNYDAYLKQSSSRPQACNFIKKESLAHVFSCKFCEITKNTFFTEHFRWLLLLLETPGYINRDVRNDIKKKMLSDKLNDPHTSATSCWSILKTLYNGKKIPLIPPISINNMLISNFKEKANHFNAFFASQCTPIPNDSTLHL